MKPNLPIIICIFFLFLSTTFGQKSKTKKSKSIQEVSLDAFKLRNVGPAFLSGRIADIKIHPLNKNIWYVAVGSGGVWKTENAGTTWKPIFDDETSYSTGCVTIDPINPDIIWVGTGENVGGRHVGYGDGIYKSLNGGKTWENMGLFKSEHISEIIVHPDDSNVVWVAAQGPLWTKGGDRGLYKTIDGGRTWKKTLGNNKWTGVTDIMLDPRDPDVIYAATWDRHRTVAALIDGGPGTAIYRSDNGGESWSVLKSGLPNNPDSNDDGVVDDDDSPTKNMGKIGLAISPQNPDVVYAAIELDRSTGGVYRSENRGESWKKMSNTVSGATGPHYYQELYASPHKFDRLYLMNVRVLTSEDGGETFEQLKERDKHSDNHAIVFRDDDPNYIMIGTDAGIYETFDLAETWKYHKNLPLTQFYKVAVNNAKPFYHIFGGTQDNGSAGGPSATDEIEGIANKHWYKTLFADGHQSATDPVYNNIVYAETQQGGLYRIDLTSGEKVSIQPQASEGEPHERFNWDAPILVSPHKPSRLYFASYRVWKSENRGDDWIPISGDLTRNENRIELPIMGRKQGWNNAWDVGAMSNYNTITSLAESPVEEGLLYAGTDDGFIQISENGGESWRKIPVTNLGLAPRTFVNDIKADLFDANTVYVALDNHKEGDYSPYLFKSTDRGLTWKSISGNIPYRTLVWRMVQDPVKENLLFAATEYGIYTSLNGGSSWQILEGSPTISFRDLTIQKRENDLVAASFGRGFFVLDDYSALREFSKTNLDKKGKLFKPRPAKWYIPKSIIGNTGSDYYFAENPTYGAVFTYHLSNDYKSRKELREIKEMELNKKNINIPFVGWENLDSEQIETEPHVILTIKDAEGNIINKITKTASEGSHRISWNMQHFNPFSVSPSGVSGSIYGGGAMATPGKYIADLHLNVDNKIIHLDGPVEFDLVPIREGVLKGVTYKEYNSFRESMGKLTREINEFQDIFSSAKSKTEAFSIALKNTASLPGNIETNLKQLQKEIFALDIKVNGSPSRAEMGEKNPPNIRTFFYNAMNGLRSTYGPTGLHKSSLDKANSSLAKLRAQVDEINKGLMADIEKELKNSNSPFISTKLSTW